MSKSVRRGMRAFFWLKRFILFLESRHPEMSALMNGTMWIESAVERLKCWQCRVDWILARKYEHTSVLRNTRIREDFTIRASSVLVYTFKIKLCWKIKKYQMILRMSFVKWTLSTDHTRKDWTKMHAVLMNYMMKRKSHSRLACCS